jgi:hypothetical protein
LVSPAKREIAYQALWVDQARTEQQAQPVSVRLLAQEAFGEGRAQDPRKALAGTGHRESIPPKRVGVEAGVEE